MPPLSTIPPGLPDRGLLSAEGTIDLTGLGKPSDLYADRRDPISEPSDAWTADRQRRRTLPPTDDGVGPRLTLPAPPAPPMSAASWADEKTAPRAVVTTAEELAHQTLVDLYALGDYAGALREAEMLLGLDGDDEVAQEYAGAAREGLEAHYFAKLGSPNRMYAVSVGSQELKWLGLDPQAHRVLALLDGESAVRDVLERSGVERIVALKVLVELLEASAIRHVR